MAEQQPPAKRMRFTSDFVTIKATLGDKTESFCVHEDIVKERSEYFSAAFDRKWREGQAREIEMQEDDPETVSSYLEFIYRGTVSSASFTENPHGPEHINRLAHLYVFGEKIQDDAFCDEVLRTLASRCDEKDADWLDGDVTNYHQEFLIELARALLTVKVRQKDRSAVKQIHKWMKKTKNEIQQGKDGKEEDSSDDDSEGSV